MKVDSGLNFLITGDSELYPRTYIISQSSIFFSLSKRIDNCAVQWCLLCWKFSTNTQLSPNKEAADKMVVIRKDNSCEAALVIEKLQLMKNTHHFPCKHTKYDWSRFRNIIQSLNISLWLHHSSHISFVFPHFLSFPISISIWISVSVQYWISEILSINHVYKNFWIIQ